MSTLVIVRKKNRIVIGADSLTSEGSIKIPSAYYRGNEKLFRYRGSIIGTVGSSALNYMLKSAFKAHPDLVDLSGTAAIYETFRALHPILKDDYYVETGENDDDQEFESNQTFALIANATGAYWVGSYREVESIDRFWAIGSGTKLALGAMHAVYGKTSNPREIAKAGLAAACEFDNASGLPMKLHAVTVAGS